MRLLAVETATEACSLALAVGDKTFSRHVVAGRDQTAVLLPLLHELMKEGGITFSELDGIACGVGPGSFAGVRVGVGFVKGFAMARDLPVVPVLSLACLAQGAMRRHQARHVLSCIDARMGEVYTGAFERDANGLAQSTDALRVCKPEALSAEMREPWIATGTGWGAYGAVLATRLSTAPAITEGDALPEAIDTLTLARAAFAKGEAVTVDALEPVYLRNDVALTLEQQARARQNRIANKKETT